MITLFHIAPQGFNVGNQAIQAGLMPLVHEAFGQVVNVVPLPATSRHETNRRAGLSAATVHEINQYGDGVIVGGGNLFENGDLDLDLEALKALEVPLMLFSVSWGRIYNRSRRLVRRTDAMADAAIAALVERSSVALARDGATVDHLHAIGATSAVLGGCPTLFLGDSVDRLPAIGPDDDGLALLSVRNPQLMNVPLSVQAAMHGQVLELVALLEAAGYDKIRLLCHDHRDIPFAASFAGHALIYTADAPTYLALLRSCAISVGYRLHAALPAASFGRPVIKLSYDERGLSLLDSAGLGSWNIDIVTSPDPMAEVEDRLGRIGDLDATLAEARPRWAELRRVQLDGLRTFAAEVTSYHATAG